MKTTKQNNRVVVAMSGGVDSSVAAALLKQAGYDVIGITMCFGTSLSEAVGKHPACCGVEAINDAKRTAAKIGIKHYVLNFGKVFQKKVIDDFIKSYLRGQTPNPCIRCNQFVKFDALLKKAKELNARFLATGHFAKIGYDNFKKEYFINKGKDKRYDQSYFLSFLRPLDLKFFILPLGNLTKQEVRDKARKFALAVAEKPSSQEICFGQDDYRKYFKNRADRAGDIKLTGGRVVGRHRGIEFFTIGQREGLGVALGKPQYVNKIDVKRNAVIIGDKADCLFSACEITEINWLSAKSLKSAISGVQVKIRYTPQDTPCRVKIYSKRRAKIIFKSPQFAVTPGQAAVVYKKDRILLAGKITKAFH